MSPRKISRLESFQHAFHGIGYTFRTQRNAQIHLAIALMIVIVGLEVGLPLAEWAILALTIGLVITAETLNTALEVAMDHLSPAIHPEVKIVKDVSAGAVLLAALTAVVVGLLILGPPLLQLLTP